MPIHVPVAMDLVCNKTEARTELVVLLHRLLLADLEALGVLDRQVIVVVAGHACCSCVL
jgi:hypothetical protein